MAHSLGPGLRDWWGSADVVAEAVQRQTDAYHILTVLVLGVRQIARVETALETYWGLVSFSGRI